MKTSILHTQNSAPDVTQKRSCGACNVCCYGWLKETVKAPTFTHELTFGSPCPAVQPSGCSIYESRPNHPCRTFKCGWLVDGSPFPEEYRPDKIGVIVVLINWKGKRAWILTSGGKEPSEDMLARMRLYSSQTGEPHLIKKGNTLKCFGSQEFQADMLELEKKGENPW